ncbi:arylesterase [Kangiella shandongensis]|uniref:arylesterase n=1 Tax=Kangiella shandongensis TaxID=2763258 RepID=UPI001CC17F96|nr:arylesterase [Kangiella shandongensis]
MIQQINNKLTMFKQFLAWILFPVVTVLTLSMAPTTQAQSQGTILVLGDSLSSGYNFSPDKTWVALLEQKLGEENINYDVINSSISGDTTTQGLKRLPKLLEVYSPELVIIELGGNDGLRGFPPNVIKSNLSTLVKQSKNAGAEVLLLGIQIPPNYGEKYAQAFFENYQQLANEHQIGLVPFLLKDVGGKNELMQDDGIHPNEKAQPTLLNNVWPKVQETLKAN